MAFADLTSLPGSKYPDRFPTVASGERNRQPIAAALAPLCCDLGGGARVLELASGFGLQIVSLAERCAELLRGANEEPERGPRFFPTEADEVLRVRIDLTTAGRRDIRQARVLDVLDEQAWTDVVQAALHDGDDPALASRTAAFAAVIAINLTHIAPWEVTQRLFERLDARGPAPAVLDQDLGFLALYGPFNEEGRFTSAGNEQFDSAIRARNAAYGLRDLQREIVPLAESHGYRLTQRIEMPSGNLLLVFRAGRG